MHHTLMKNHIRNVVVGWIVGTVFVISAVFGTFFYLYVKDESERTYMHIVSSTAAALEWPMIVGDQNSISGTLASVIKKQKYIVGFEVQSPNVNFVVGDTSVARQIAEDIYENRPALFGTAAKSVKVGTLIGYFDESVLFEKQIELMMLIVCFGAALIFTGVMVSKQLSRRVVAPMMLLSHRAKVLNENLDREVAVPSPITELNDLSGALEMLRGELVRVRHMEKEQREELIASRELTLNNAASKMRFMSIVNHELRTPLSNIILALEQLNERAQGMVETMLVQAAMSEAQSVRQLIGQVLDYAQTDNGAFAVRPEPTNLPKTIELLLANLRAQASEKNIKFNENISPLLVNHLIEIDGLRVRQIITNLTNNALKFTHHGGFVNLNIIAKPTNIKDTITLVISVTDSGIGILAAEVDQIFEPFRQGSNTSNTSNHGVGLGLPIVKKLLSSMNGRIEVHSSYGTGSTFTATMNVPIIMDGRQQEEEVAVVQYKKLDNEQTILVVDDNEFTRHLMQILLESWGMSVKLAKNGSEGISLFREHEFDVVLLDIQMPDMLGTDVVLHLRDIERQHGRGPTTIIAFTGNAMPDTESRCLERGFSSVLFKPFDNKDLFDRIETALHVKESLLQMAETRG